MFPPKCFAHLATRGSMRTVLNYQKYQELTPKYKCKSTSNSSLVQNYYWTTSTVSGCCHQPACSKSAKSRSGLTEKQCACRRVTMKENRFFRRHVSIAPTVC